jgi:hypothetical protein
MVLVVAFVIVEDFTAATGFGFSFTVIIN